MIDSLELKELLKKKDCKRNLRKFNRRSKIKEKEFKMLKATKIAEDKIIFLMIENLENNFLTTI